MDLLVFFGVADVLFLLGLNAVYVFVTRRRAKLYVLIEHLAELARRAMPLGTGLRQIAADLRGRLGAKMDRVARHLEDGRPFAEAVAAVPGAFPPAVAGFLALGERCGNLAGMLEELRKTYGRMSETASRTVYYFLYPVLLTLFISAVLAGLQAGIVPKFMEIAKQTGFHVDYEARWSALSTANQAVFALCLGLAAFIFVGGGSVHFGGGWSRPVRAVLGRAALAVPVLAAVVRDRSAAQFAAAVGLVVRAGGALPEALRAAADVEGNPVLARCYARLAARVAEGERFSAAARRERAFPDEFLWFVEAGEASGALADHLRDAAAHYDTRARFAAQVASRAVIPFFVLLNGALVLAACLLTYRPMIDILQKVTPS